jgi:enamine deaminase RidA (YjgF/YER057c/UK114 family)
MVDEGHEAKLALVSFESVPGAVDNENLTGFCRPDGGEDNEPAGPPQPRPRAGSTATAIPALLRATCTRLASDLRAAVRSAKKIADFAAHLEAIMAGMVEKKLQELGVVLAEPTAPSANYVPFVRTGNLLMVSGQICYEGGKLVAAGKLGAGVSVEEGQRAARACAINVLAQVKVALGDLDKVVRVVRLGGFVNSAPSFLEGPKVMNGASDLMVAAFGDKGRHARTTVGVAVLPADAAMEVEALFEVS